jgi:hypothetical protein
MRLPFPERLPLVPVVYFAVLLCAAQLAMGTNSTFALCCFFYVLVAASGFNLAGGFTRTSGVFIFFNSILGVILGLCMKIYLGEPGDSNLLSPILTMQVLLAGMCMMVVAVYLSKRVSTKRALMGKMVTDSNMQTATVGCLIAGMILNFAGFVLPTGQGSVLSAMNQLNRFFPLAIILGVINSIRRSGGTRSVNLPVILAGATMFVNGLFGFSKEGMFAPFACWALAAASQRYKVNRFQMIGGIFIVFFSFQYLVPYAQYGRNFRGDDLQSGVSNSLMLLSDLGSVRQQYLSISADSYDERILGYYSKPQGFFDRLQMVSIDDALINRTAQSGTYGIYPVVAAFENMVPHFIWKDKPVLLAGNVYAHEVGLLGEEDDSTGVSFSSTSSSFHLLGWQGIIFLAPAVWFMLFLIFDSLCGDVRKTPWGLLVLVLYTHAAPEGDIGACIYMCFYTTIAIVFAGVMGAYVMPVLGTFFIGPEGILIRRGAPIRSIPKRLVPSAAPKV